MKVFVAADHRGFAAKQAVLSYLQKRAIRHEDLGDDTYNPDDDFPVFALRATHAVLSENDARAVLLCGSGQGMVMAANRIKGIRAGLGWNKAAAWGIRNDEDSNIIAIPAELYDANPKLVFTIIDTFLETPFANAARYVRRNKQLDTLS